MAVRKFDRCLKNLLTLTGVSCEELAQRLGIAVPVVRRWMNGTTAPDIYQLQETARFFGLPCAWFLDGGDGFPDAEQLAELLGLNADTLEGLLLLAETEDEEVLTAVDDAIFSVVSAFRSILEGAE